MSGLIRVEKGCGNAGVFRVVKDGELVRLEIDS
jgi:hypothetical protein